MSRARARRVAAGASALALVVGGPLAAASGSPGQVTRTAKANPNHPVTASKTVTRTNILPDGKQQTVVKKKVTVSVSATAGLRTLQQINVSWKGAYPTNYIDPDPNSANASSYQEYPVVVMECRGVDSTKVPAKDRLTQQNCWTQYNIERNASAPGTEFPPWRLDRYAGKLGLFPHKPKTLPTGCSPYSLGEADYFEPLKAENGKSYFSGPTQACSKLSPEQAGFSAEFPDNTTFGVTAADGTGRAKFVVWSSETNETLGCSASVKCSLVVIPIVGISCDERARSADETQQDIDNCDYADTQSGHLENGPGELSDPGQMALESVTGQLWWSASNWRNRISIPLNFALPSDYCSVVSKRPGVFVFGSELMTETAQQWSPAFCTDPKRTPFTQIPLAEPAAVNELNERSISAAFDSYPPAPAGKAGPPVVNAPVAVTGFAISTVVDDASRNEDFNVKLDPRLLAKLLTESYPDLPDIAANDGMANNPLNITLDPEFRALNPEIPKEDAGSGYQIITDARATLIALSSNSDVMHALTSYIASDPAAVAFIDGKPDPWGMVVNPAYKGLKLPVNIWPLLDTYIPYAVYNHDPTGCFAQPRYQTPYLPLVASPLLTLSSIAYDLEFSMPNSKTSCSVSIGNPAADQLTTGPRQTPGERFLLGITTLSEAKRYDLDTAELETQSSVSPTTAFTTAKGMTFVHPTPASLKSATKALTADKVDNSWSMDYDKLRNSPAESKAYPGTMMVSMSVPSAGLSTPDAKAYAEILNFAAGPGQKPGPGFGQLAAGYLPMTAANGLGSEVSYTKRAAAAVAAQQCEVPDVSSSAQTRSKWTSCPAPSSSPSPTPSTSTSSTPSSPPSSGNQSIPPVKTPSPGTSSSSPTGPTVAGSASPTPVAVATPVSPVGSWVLFLPIVALAGLVAGGAAGGTWLLRRYRGGRGTPS
ncbi:MAG TPA: hypothetical protein VME70_01855 [Mycobacteriales bacterium]|nr:hypothetical protein [Mycobacteriales bacterium]